MSDTTQASAPAKAVIGPYRHEKTLFAIVAGFSILFWLLLTLGTIGIIWIYMAFIYLFVVMVHSALISHLKGNAVRIDQRQFPELHARIEACAAKVGLSKLPEAYLMTGNGMLNAFATRFLRRYYVVLLSDVVDALEEDQDGINFYIGHELGHVARQHVAHHWWIGPVLFMPLLGTAYRRAQEYTCDQYGAACCASLASASRALAVLAAGSQRWKQLDAQAFIDQMSETKGFWMSLNELTSEYPWLCKRMARLHDPAVKTPRRHPLAWFFATFMPNSGPGGLVVSMIFLVAMIGLLAAIAIPAYHDYSDRIVYPADFSYAKALAAASQAKYEAEQELPSDPATLGIAAPDNVAQVTMNSDTGEIAVSLKNGKEIIQQPYMGEDEKLAWNCSTSIPGKAIPLGIDCESSEEPAGGGALLEKLLRN